MRLPPRTGIKGHHDWASALHRLVIKNSNKQLIINIILHSLRHSREIKCLFMIFFYSSSTRNTRQYQFIPGFVIFISIDHWSFVIKRDFFLFLDFKQLFVNMFFVSKISKPNSYINSSSSIVFSQYSMDDEQQYQDVIRKTALVQQQLSCQSF